MSIYTKDGFHSDLNETYLVGNVNTAGKKLVKCAYECLAAAISVCKPGERSRRAGGRDGWAVTPPSATIRSSVSHAHLSSPLTLWLAA